MARTTARAQPARATAEDRARRVEGCDTAYRRFAAGRDAIGTPELASPSDSGNRLDDKIVLITGASSGIGEATARVLAAAGGRVDAIVNNAGLMPLSPLAALKIDEWDRMIDVNVRGVLHGIAAVLPRMNARGYGHVVNVSSTGGLSVVPTAAVCCATKYAARAISDGLRLENDQLRVTCVYPGVVESELAGTITAEAAAAMMVEYRRIALKPDAIARAIRHALEQAADVDTSEIVVRPTAARG